MDFALLTLGDTGWGDELLRGLVTTVALAVLSYLFGIVLGLLGAFGKQSPRLSVRFLAESYTTVVRGIPTLVLVFIIFFGLETLIGSALDAFGYTGQVFLDAFTMGVIAIGLLSGAYSTEAIRGALVAIPIGQIEAARAFGMPPWLIFRRITLPQLLRIALPSLGNVWQLTLKDTSLISVMGLTDLMRQAFVAGNSTREPFTFFLAAALLYLVVSAVTNRLFDVAERRYSRGMRRA